MTDVFDNRPHHRFDLEVDGHVASSFYELGEGVITFVHTEVPPELGGRGIGSSLVQGARKGARRRIEGGSAMPFRQSLDRQAPGI